MARSFPANFWFGAATAAYQIEGAVTDGGRGPSIWDTFSHTPGRTANGDTGDVACDHYHRWPGDLDLMRSLGLDAYRMSIAWPRVLPEGVGEPNREGIDFYRRLVAELNRSGIRPVVTLYHWDLPQALQDKGGWTNRATAYAFADYARLMARELGDGVALWTTLNEPWCSAYLGHASGVHAPGLTDPAAALTAVHHLNLAHGLAVQAIREELGSRANVSVTLNLHVVHPENPQSDDDWAAVRQVQTMGNDVFLAPMLEGRMPEGLADLTSSITDWSCVQDGDLDLIHQQLDVLGINYYTTTTVRRTHSGDIGLSGGHGETGHSPWVGCSDVTFLPPSGSVTAMGWGVEPAGMTELLLDVSARYPQLPLMVTENGVAWDDEVGADHRVHDPRRISYLHDHLAAVLDATEAGADVRGYFVWSLLDNFEWAWGYTKRFGITWVDYPTQQRLPKDSFDWYREVIASRAIQG